MEYFRILNYQNIGVTYLVAKGDHKSRQDKVILVLN